MRLSVLFFFLPMLCYPGTPTHKGKVAGYLNAYFAVEGLSPREYSDFYQFLEKLQTRKSHQTNKQFVNLIFKKTHQKYLHHFKEFATFSEFITTGNYNCLTATSLYALILDYFVLDYEIIETNYHIFILVNIDDGQILLETTDPLQGFIADPAMIRGKIKGYQSNTLVNENSKTSYRFSNSLYNEVTLDQIVGLLHYNLAVDTYNHGYLLNAINHLEQATQFYYSKRTKEFSDLLLLKIQRTAPFETRRQLIARVQQINQVENNFSLAKAAAF
jgi:hypothetical protein